MQTQANNMATVAKTQSKTKKKPIISKENRREIARAYYQLYRAFLLKNLLAGMTLGAASHNALQLMRAKIASMDNNNPVTIYLKHIHARHSRRVAKRIMTSKYRDAHATTNAGTRARLTAMIPKWTQTALDTLNKMSAQYQQKTIAKAAPVKTVEKPANVVEKPNADKKATPVNQPITLLQIKLQQMNLQNRYQYAA